MMMMMVIMMMMIMMMIVIMIMMMIAVGDQAAKAPASISIMERSLFSERYCFVQVLISPTIPSYSPHH